MKSSKLFSLLLAIVSLAFSAPALAVDVTGTWEGFSVVGSNQYANSFTLSSQGEKVFGSFVVNGTPCTYTGTLVGNTLTLHSDCPGINYSSDSTATTDGFTMAGTFLDSQNTSGTFSAQKIDVPDLTPATTIDFPPIVRAQNQNVTFVLLKFRKAALLSQASSRSTRKTGGLSVRYTITVKGAERRKIVSAKNRATAKNLKPGNYTATYKVSAVRNSRPVFSTNVSPVANFTVRK